ncbi:MAG: serine hydrolase domain-containing protein [Bryobacteraceae bacterium]
MKLSAAVALLAVLSPVFASDNLPVPRFTDPGRRSKLATAFPEIEKIFDQFQQQKGIPGMVFGVVIDGELALVKTFGMRDRKTKDPVTPDTAFRIASMTKSFTVLAILKLRDAGKLSLDDPASKWIPELAAWKYPTQDTLPIRIRELLTHGAGFPEDNPWGDRQLAISEEGLTRWLQAGLPFSTTPDTAYEYSNYGFALLGRIVTKASGMPYREYLEKQILAPIGMRSSSLEPGSLPAPSRAMGYKKIGDEYLEEPSLAHGTFGAMGGLVTTARDLAKYVAYQLSAFPPRDDAQSGPVRRSSQREMQRPARFYSLTANRTTPDAPLQATVNSYGYGLRISADCRFEHIVGHGGGLPGFGSYMMWLPDYGVGMFAMANLTYTGPAPPMSDAYDALRKTGALQPRQLPPSPVLISTRDSIVRLWNKWDDSDAEALAADNFFPDTSAARRRQEIDKIKAEVGQCAQIGDVKPENLLRGKFRMGCDRGTVEASFTLAPTIPPRLQFLRFAPAVNLDSRTKAAVDELAALVGNPQPKRLQALSIPQLPRQMEALRNSYGSCRAGETIGGDGKTSVRVKFECDRGPLEVQMRFDDGAKLREAAFTKPADVPCVP